MISINCARCRCRCHSRRHLTPCARAAAPASRSPGAPRPPARASRRRPSHALVLPSPAPCSPCSGSSPLLRGRHARHPFAASTGVAPARRAGPSSASASTVRSGPPSARTRRRGRVEKRGSMNDFHDPRSCPPATPGLRRWCGARAFVLPWFASPGMSGRPTRAWSRAYVAPGESVTGADADRGGSRCARYWQGSATVELLNAGDFRSRPVPDGVRARTRLGNRLHVRGRSRAGARRSPARPYARVASPTRRPGRQTLRLKLTLAVTYRRPRRPTASRTGRPRCGGWCVTSRRQPASRSIPAPPGVRVASRRPGLPDWARAGCSAGWARYRAVPALLLASPADRRAEATARYRAKPARQPARAQQVGQAAEMPPEPRWSVERAAAAGVRWTATSAARRSSGSRSGWPCGCG